ncbi:CAAX protease [Lonsdalea populi]|uniref:CPBP family intramembrane metalloprotease n=1 Tax=Lonsdalea populi TaxID=1172565 RepID=A0A3N0UB33_9GAMM|nr:CAAX protease [Lonsdalea quercina]RAT25011.1 CAAX protease [Lonsdalea populi]RAT30558.1 CAAX protease [Lonsdalea populi]RAT40738.1 CAAX protease [Lonsdalea populi]RAT48858.1 CAAX protease [Lonsdalea populi]
MEYLLGLALVALTLHHTIAGVLLAFTLMVAWLQDVITLPVVGTLCVAMLIGYRLLRYRDRKWIAAGGEGLLVLLCILLFLHLVPGFHNPKVLDRVVAGPHSAPFSLYYNLDKALAPFLPWMAIPDLFYKVTSESRPRWQWGLLMLTVPALLLLAVVLGGLRFELHWPAWLGQFVLANIFFVSLAEEALFRGYLQRRLTQCAGPLPALIVTATLFGLAHFQAGPLMMIFAGLAGLIYGAAWYWSGRLWVSTAFHFALNLTHLLCFTYPYFVR